MYWFSSQLLACINCSNQMFIQQCLSLIFLLINFFLLICRSLQIIWLKCQGWNQWVHTNNACTWYIANPCLFISLYICNHSPLFMAMPNRYNAKVAQKVTTRHMILKIEGHLGIKWYCWSKSFLNEFVYNSYFPMYEFANGICCSLSVLFLKF